MGFKFPDQVWRERWLERMDAKRTEESEGAFLDAIRYLSEKQKNVGVPVFTAPKGYKLAIDGLNHNGNSGTWSSADPKNQSDEADDIGVWNSSIYNWGDKPSVHPVVACDHVWIDVGFQFSKFVCSKCNKDKPND